MNMRCLLCALALVCSGTAADESARAIVCMPRPVACQQTSAERFDPQLQRYLVERQLELQPKHFTTVYLYLPPLEDRELQELQIRYLEELLAREKGKAEK